MRMACAIVFVVFTFLFVYDYQTDLIAYTQHVLSRGATTYNRIVGAVVITLALTLLSVGVRAVLKLRARFHALVYFPSLLLLVLLAGGQTDGAGDLSFGFWMWAFPLSLVVYAGVLFFCHGILNLHIDISQDRWYSQMMWENMLLLLLQFAFTVGISNHDDVFHEQLCAERLLAEGHHEEALDACSRIAAPDTVLTCLRAMALSRMGTLGERMFEKPVTGGSTALQPDGHAVRLAMLPADSFYCYVGKRPMRPMSTIGYLHFLERHHLARRPAADYLLTACLLDKDLDGFVSTVGRYYKVDSLLPKHYREALTLYTHTRSTPRLVYHTNVMDADFQDYQALERKFPDKRERQTALRATYGNTYWYYWQYGR